MGSTLSSRYLGAAILGMCLLASCEIPQSATLKAEPGLRLFLGSPFVGDDNPVMDFLNVDSFTSQMGSNFDGLVYSFKSNAIHVSGPVSDPVMVNGNTEIQTFLVHFQIPIIPAPSITGEITLPLLAELFDFFGDVSLKYAPVYFYFSGLQNPDVELGYKESGKAGSPQRLYGPQAVDGNVSFTRPRPGSPYTETLPTPSVLLPFADVLNKKTKQSLTYTLTLPASSIATITSASLDIVLVLPFWLEVPRYVNGVDQGITIDNEQYIALSKSFMPEGQGDFGDFFSREGSGDDFSFLSFDGGEFKIREAGIQLMKIENTVTQDLALGITESNPPIVVNLSKSGERQWISFTEKSLEGKFNPGIAFLVRDPGNGNPGDLRFMPLDNAAFDLVLAAGIKAEISVDLF